MIRTVGIAFVAFVAFLGLLAAVQSLDDQVLAQIEQQQSFTAHP